MVSIIRSNKQEKKHVCGKERKNELEKSLNVCVYEWLNRKKEKPVISCNNAL